MTQIPLLCRGCGLRFNFGGIGIVKDKPVTITRSAVGCPRCGTLADIPDGKYDYLGNVIEAFAGATEEQLRRFQEVATAVAAGKISNTEADNQATKIRSEFGRIITLALQWGIPSLLVAVIALYLQWLDSMEATRSSERMLSELHGMKQQGTELNQEIQKMEMMQNTYESQGYLPQMPITTLSLPPSKTQAAPNRHERRKANAIGRHNKRH